MIAKIKGRLKVFEGGRAVVNVVLDPANLYETDGVGDFARVKIHPPSGVPIKVVIVGTGCVAELDAETIEVIQPD